MHSWTWKRVLLLCLLACCMDTQAAAGTWRDVSLFREANESDTEWDESFARRAQFSFALRQRVDRGGDTSLLVRYNQVLQDYEFKLTAAERADLGALLTPPNHIPASTAFDAADMPMQVGHYYCMRTGDVYVLLQVTKFVYQMTDRVVTFRYLASQDGLEGLNSQMAAPASSSSGEISVAETVTRSFILLSVILLVFGFVIVVGGAIALRLKVEDREASKGAVLSGSVLCLIVCGAWLAYILYKGVSSVFIFIAESWPLFLGGIVVLTGAATLGCGWNILYRKLNAVKRTRRAVDVLLGKAEYTPEALLKVAREAGEHERRFHTDIAKAHSRQSLFVIGGVSFRQNPPDVTATPLFGTAQTEIRQGEGDLVSAWADWAEAAEEYENARNSFPLVVVASLCRFPTIDFPNA